MKIRRGCWGTVYRPKGRSGEPTRWWWLKIKFPGDARPRRMPTSPRTDDEAEARRQLAERLGERNHVRVHRERAEDMTVRDVLGLYLAHVHDRGLGSQPGRVEPWNHLLGYVRALEVTTGDLRTICKQWERVGLQWDAGSIPVPGHDEYRYGARDEKRVRPVSGATCNRLLAALRKGYSLAKEERGLVTPLVFKMRPEGKRGEYLTEAQAQAITGNFQAARGADVKSDVFRLSYLLGVRKGQLTRTLKRHVLITGGTWKLQWPKEMTKNDEAHVIALEGEAQAIVERAWSRRRPDCDLLFHIEGKPLGTLRSEFRRTCEVLGIPYGRGRGVVWHDTRHSAVTNLVNAGVPEPVAMTLTGHADPSIFKRYNIRLDAVQADALARLNAYLAAQRDQAKSPSGARQ